MSWGLNQWKAISPPQEYSALAYTWELCARQGELRSKNTIWSSPLPLTRLLSGSQQLDPLQSLRHTNCEKLHFPQLSDDLVHWTSQLQPLNSKSRLDPALLLRPRGNEFKWGPGSSSPEKNDGHMALSAQACPCLRDVYTERKGMRTPGWHSWYLWGKCNRKGPLATSNLLECAILVWMVRI